MNAIEYIHLIMKIKRLKLQNIYYLIIVTMIKKKVNDSINNFYHKNYSLIKNVEINFQIIIF